MEPQPDPSSSSAGDPRSTANLLVPKQPTQPTAMASSSSASSSSAVSTSSRVSGPPSFKHRRRASTPYTTSDASRRLSHVDVHVPLPPGARSPDRANSPGLTTTDSSDPGWSSGASSSAEDDDEGVSKRHRHDRQSLREKLLATASASHPAWWQDPQLRRMLHFDRHEWASVDWQQTRRDVLEYLDLSLSKTYEDFRARGIAQAHSFVDRAKRAEDVLYAAALRLSQKGKNLIRYEDLPTLWKNNEHILSGYRFIPSSEMGALLRSTFELHNETLNIHSHLLGAIMIIPLFWPSKDMDPDTTPTDRLVQTIYLVAALKCLLCSVSWHVMAGCADACLYERYACVDYTGIAWLVAASVWTLVYNGFHCQPNLALFYSGTTLAVGFVGAIVPWAPWFNERRNKAWRIVVFVAMSLTALMPISHAAFQHGPLKAASFFSPIVPSVLCYVGGLVFYALQWPERSAPGRFDIWGHSHTWWHLAIVGAILLHHRAALAFHANRFDFSCAAVVADSATSAKDGGLASLVMDAASEAATLGAPSHTSPSSSSSALPHYAVMQTASALLEAAGGLQGAQGLERADSVVLGWRRALGRLGGGLVGRAWDHLVDWTQTW